MKLFLKSFFTLFFAITTIFFALRLTPGDPVERLLGPEAKVEEIQKYRAELGLDKGLVEQYFDFAKGIITLDLGMSFFKKESVVTLIKQNLPPTLVLALISILISTPIGIGIGVVSAIKKSQLPDTTIRVITLTLLSFPIFSLAPLLVLVFSIKLGIFPVSQWESVMHMVIPVTTLVLPLSSVIVRVMRNKYLEEESQLWVLVLNAKGLTNSAIIYRLVKICMPTILNVVAIQLSVVLAGTVITETIFDIPGLGSLLFEAINNRDYPLVQGIIAYSTVIYMLVYVLVDYLNEKIDPRIG
ncbi:ABC transporter, permease protein [Bacteriovorax sp. BAL6_X]|uniref:ABC transporter permease n=1 Tax=Bacteriovorax sp. BAL6_X TaxID=1201290 RepID=UPI0003857AD5|nr:ABC transporter permease [Bacteriovorax sp. BAL6_X]EPZ51982.1 ABC transporter, permease protein [Bacteriovorax sp. BAL6_X]